MPEIILHQWEISPYCGKVRRLLRHKGLPFQVREYNGLRVLAAGKLSPAGKLPVLEYDSERLQDSSRIAAFIEERHPEPALIPKSGREAHLVHIFEDWADESLYWYEVYFRFMWTEAADKAFAVIQQGRPAWEKKLIVTSAVPMMRQKLARRASASTTPPPSPNSSWRISATSRACWPTATGWWAGSARWPTSPWSRSSPK